MKAQGRVAILFERQWLHAAALTALLVGAWFLARGCPCFHRGEVWGISTWTWFWLAVDVAIAHQVFVALFWRVRLHTDAVPRLFGSYGFEVYAAVFTALILARPVIITILAVSSEGSLVGNRDLFKILAVIAAIPVLYLLYSIARYFGFKRAYGIDHFDPSWRTRPLVREGIFRLTRNAMYTFGFLVLYIPGLWLASRPAILAAVFSHLYIWVHYFTVEKPDMARIYGSA
jgi:protein-S-isoprenylcysteine O-methyltransferase Ste14